MLKTYLRYEPEEIALVSYNPEEKITNLLEEAFVELKGQKYKVRSSYVRHLALNADLLAPNRVAVHEAICGKRNQPTKSVLAMLTGPQLLQASLDGSSLHVSTLCLDEIAVRPKKEITFTDTDFEKMSEIIPEGARGAARAALLRCALRHGLGTIALAEEACDVVVGNMDPWIIQFVKKEVRKRKFDSSVYSIFIPVLARHMRSPGVTKTLVQLVTDNSANAAIMKDYSEQLGRLLAEEFEVQNVCEIVHWAAMASSKAKQDLMPRLPIFHALIGKYRVAALRAALGIMFENAEACQEFRKIGLPEWNPDVETARVFELLTALDPDSRSEIREYVDPLWDTARTTIDPDILAAVLHIITSILTDDNSEEIRMRAEFHEQSIREEWSPICVAAVKKHPFVESVQQFGMELVSLLSTLDTRGTLLSGGYILARVASVEFPTNDSIRASQRIMSDLVDDNDPDIWKYT